MADHKYSASGVYVSEAALLESLAAKLVNFKVK